VSAPTRIPPLSEQLEFARNTETGRVHILCHGPDRHWIPVTRKDNPEGTAVLNLISAPCRMLCGARLFVSAMDGHQAVWASGDHFADDALCIRCVQALGDQQWRAFHADNRGSS
jgi:hypothetical protein